MVEQINKCDFCLCKKMKDCEGKPECKQPYFWCSLPDEGCGYNEAKEDCYGFEKCPNVKEFYLKKQETI